MKMTDEQRQKISAIMHKHMDAARGKPYIPMGMSDEAMKEISDAIETVPFSESVKKQVAEENNLDDPHFKGEAYEKEIDQKALKKGFIKVFAFMVENCDWHSDIEIAEETGVYVPSVQRYRSYCRSVEWGSHVVERRRREGCRIFEYRLIPNKASLTYKWYLKSHNIVDA